MPGPSVLLGSYAARVISWVAGVLSSCRPSGGVSLVLQNLVGARWSSSGHPCFLSECTLRPGLGLDLAFWVFHVWFFSGSPSGSGGGGGSFAFVTVW